MIEKGVYDSVYPLGTMPASVKIAQGHFSLKAGLKEKTTPCKLENYSGRGTQVSNILKKVVGIENKLL